MRNIQRTDVSTVLVLKKLVKKRCDHCDRYEEMSVSLFTPIKARIEFETNQRGDVIDKSITLIQLESADMEHKCEHCGKEMSIKMGESITI